MEQEVYTEDPQQEEQQPAPKLSVPEFASKIKTKYPQYKDVPDDELVAKIINKYPQYKDSVELVGGDKKKVEPPVQSYGLGKAEIASIVPKEEPKVSEGFKPTNDEFARRKAHRDVVAQNLINGKIPSLKEFQDKIPKYAQVNQPVSTDTNLPEEVAMQNDSMEDKTAKNEIAAQTKDEAIENTAKKILAQKGIINDYSKPLGVLQYAQLNEEKNKLKEAVENGDAVVTRKKGEAGLNRTIGWWEGLSKGWNEATRSSDEADEFVNNMDAQEKLNFLAKQQEENKHPEYLGEKGNGVGSMGEFVGSNAPFLGKAVAGTILGTAATALAPETGGISTAALPTAMAFLFTAPDMVNQGAMGEIMRRYETLKRMNPDKDELALMQEAEQGKWAGGGAGLATNALLMGTGIKMPVSATGKAVIGKAITKALESSVHMGATTAAVEGVKQLEGNLEGIKSTPEDIAKSMATTFEENATVGLLLHTMTQAVNGAIKLPKALKSAIKYGLKDANPAELGEVLKMNEAQGVVPEGTAEKVVGEVEAYKKALSKTADDLPPEVQASVAGLIEAKDKIIAERETKDETQRAVYDEKIAAINEQINKTIETGKPYEHEVNELSGETYGEESKNEPQKGEPENISQPIELSAEVTPKEEVKSSTTVSSGAGSVGVGGDVGQKFDIKRGKNGFEGDFLNDYELIGEGSEHTVYRKKGSDKVIRLSEPYSDKSETTFNQRVRDAKLIDEIIGDGSLNVIGYYESENGTKNPIYEQNFQDSKPISEKEVEAHLRNIGGIEYGDKYNRGYLFNHNGKWYKINDYSDNFFKDKNGKIVAIDAAIVPISEAEINKARENDAEFNKAVEKSYNDAIKEQMIELPKEEDSVGVGGDVEAKRIETEAKIKRKDLFSDGGIFANELGGSGVNSVPTNHSERNGIEFVQFSNPNTGIVDVIMTGKSDNDFVGYYRIYENGKATNKWSSKFENQSRNKEDFKTMIGGVQEMLPEGHEYTEKTSISTDGLRVWNQQLSRGYELQYDSNGNLITNRVAINGDAITNELGITVNKGNFENVSVTNNTDMKKVKTALLPYLQKFGLNESNIHFENGTVEIDLPILKNKKSEQSLKETPKSENKPIQNEPASSTTVSSGVEGSVGVGGGVKTGLLDYFRNIKKDSAFDELVSIGENMGIGVKEYDGDSPLAANFNGTDVTINKRFGKPSTNNIAHEVIHGILHKLTSNEYKGSSLDVKLQKFKKELFDYIDNKGIDNLGLKPELKILYLDYIRKSENSQEIVTFAFTNGQFHNFLSSIKSEGVANKSKTLWGKLKDIFKSTLQEVGIKSKLDDLVDLLDSEVPLKAVEQSLKETPKSENKPIQNEPIKEGAESTQRQLPEEVKPTEASPVESGKSAEAATGKKELDKMASSIPNSGEVKKYLSGDTIKKYEEGAELRNNQEIIAQELEPALKHGVETIDKAKEIFGEDYVPKTLDYIEAENLSPENKALLYVSLENDMAKRLLADTENAGLKKLQDLVRTKSQAYLRSNSLAINMGRLRKFAEVGYDITKVADKFFSPKEIEQKDTVEKLVQANAETIQKEADEKVQQMSAEGMTPEVERLVNEGVEKEINKIYDKLPKDKKRGIDKAIAALERFQKSYKGKAYDATGAIPLAIVDAGITAIKLGLKAGAKIADAIELGVNKIKEKWGKEWEKEADFRKDMAELFKEEEKVIEPKEFTKRALIEQGFGKEVNVKTKEGVEKREVLDWKKLAGEEGSVDKISANVAKSLATRAMSDEQINAMSDAFIKEYNDLRASVVEKGLNEIAARNKTVVTPDQKSAAKKLAEMYNYGLFDKDLAEYQTVLAKTIGVDKLNPERIKAVVELGKVSADLFNSKFQGNTLSKNQLRTAIQRVDDLMRYLINQEIHQHGSNNLKIAEAATTYMDLTQRMGLVSIGQAFQNPISGKMESFFSDLGYANTNTGVLNKQARKLGNNIFKEIVKEKGVGYGNVQSQFISKGNLELILDRMTDNKLVQTILSTAIGKTILDAPDSAFKMKITQQKFTAGLISLLQKDRMVDGKLLKGMSKTDARNYVSEKIAGQSYEDAKTTAKEIIDRINKSAGTKIFNDSPLFVERLASDIVNAALINGGEITADMVDASYNSAYKAAGRGLGHVANNQISEMIGTKSGKYEKLIDDAIKDKDYKKAAALKAEAMFFRNIMNPYVGGGTNWVVLSKFEKSGIGLLSAIGSMVKRGGSKIDLTSEAGIKNLEQAMYDRMVIRDKLIRGAIGAVVTGLSLAFIDTDKYAEWSKKHPKWSKITDVLMAEATLLKVAKKKGQSTLSYLKQAFNKNDAFDKPANALKATAAVFDGDKKASVKAGGVVGSLFGAPTPWRLVRDVDNLLVEANGGEAYKVDVTPSETFMQEALKGGMIDYMGYAPHPENKWFNDDDMKSKSFVIIKEKGLELPKEGSIKQYKVDIDDNHPEGIMTQEEYDKFTEKRRGYIKEGIDEIMNKTYEVTEEAKSGKTISYKKLKGRDLEKDLLKEKIDGVSAEATKKAKEDLGLTSKKNKKLVEEF